MAFNSVLALPVLLVDDEPQLLHSVSVVLRSAGIPQVLTQSDSREVLPMLAAHEVGMLVLDLTMPHIPGAALDRLSQRLGSISTERTMLTEISKTGN